MEIKVLGSGASEGIPALFCECDVCREAREKGIFHTRSQVLIDDKILFDFPPDTYYRALSQGVDLSGVKYVFITHSHSDHYCVEDLFMRKNWRAYGKPQNQIAIYGSNAVCASYENYSNPTEKSGAVDCYENAYGLQTCSNEINFYQSVEIDGYKVTALPATHMPNEDCFIYLLEKDGKSILYATDTGDIKDEVIEFLSSKGIKLNCFIVDGTYGNGEYSDHGHMNFNEVGELKERMQKLGIIDLGTNLYITHIFHGGAKTLADFEKEKPNGFKILTDAEKINI